MPDRQHSDTNAEDLIQELDWYDHQSMNGHQRGKKALEELMYRAGLLGDERYWELDPYSDLYRHIWEDFNTGSALVAVADWLDEQDIDHDLAADPVPLDDLLEEETTA